MVHELGHAHQAWHACTVGPSHEQDPCDGGHYDSSFNAPLCNASTPAQYHSMCPSVATAESWRWRNLEDHDRDLAENMY